MVNEAFVLGLAVVCVFLLVWACKTLPAEQWQILASIPITKDESGLWRGINLTYYGLLTANAAVVAVALLCILRSWCACRQRNLLRAWLKGKNVLLLLEARSLLACSWLPGW